MRLGFCTPFRPLDHPRLSGDVTIARDLFEFFLRQGHTLIQSPDLASQWIYWRPWRWPAYLAARRATRRLCQRQELSAWFTYHSYYKAPDLLGRYVKNALGVPYFIFAGAHAAGRRKSIKTWPGYHLNKRALLAADHVFANRQKDRTHLLEILPPERVAYVRPGLKTKDFVFSSSARDRLRKEWGWAGGPVVVTVAALRPGTKSEGVRWVIRACAELAAKGPFAGLAVAGDGVEQVSLERYARELLPGRVRFLGRVAREKLFEVYSAGDVFAFPGINEALGMVYLEAQSCGLPVAAWDHDGAPQVVEDGKTGFITPSYDQAAYVEALGTLLWDADCRNAMSEAAKKHVRDKHELHTNLSAMEAIMLEAMEKPGQGR